MLENHNEFLVREHKAPGDKSDHTEPADPRLGERERSTPSAELNAERLFAMDLVKTTLLSREEETALATRIVRARKRVRSVLRKMPRLTRIALEGSGRRVLAPAYGFREREAVVILNYAQRVLEDRRKLRQLQLRVRDVRAFVAALSVALDEYRAGRDEMVNANVRLVRVLARRYRHPDLTFLDLFQEGTLGLLRAIEKYEPARKVKFSTYASWWIWQQLGRSGDTYGPLVRTPVHWHQFRRRVSRNAQELASEGEAPASRADLAAKEGIDYARFETMSQAFQFVSTDAPLGDDDERPLHSTLPDSSTPSPEEGAEHAALGTQLELAIDGLPERERFILRQRFGLATDEERTLEEIGTVLGVSRERVRQLESRALKQLKELGREYGLEEFLS
jgi:RNA polymerase primary sigma factor